MNTPINVIILGGGGFLGSSINNFLQQLGINTTVIGRRILSPMDSPNNYFSLLQIDLKQPHKFLDLNAKNYIIDLAYTSVPNTSFDDPVKDFSENLFNVVQYLEFAKVIGAKKYIYISSGGTVYGNQGKKLLTELDANFPVSPYGITKLACERYVHMYSEVHSVPGIIVRPANIYGPGQIPFRGQGLIATIMASVLAGVPIKVFGGGYAIRDYLFVDDFNHAILDILNFGQNGEIYNLGSSIGTSVNEILDEIELVTFPIPLPERIDYSGRPFDIQYNILDNTKLSKLNNWQPLSSFHTGLTKTWKLLKKQEQEAPL